jgi:hypothetical protein
MSLAHFCPTLESYNHDLQASGIHYGFNQADRTFGADQWPCNGRCPEFRTHNEVLGLLQRIVWLVRQSACQPAHPIL